ncbi:MAG: chorismate-binding protein, partial [Pseudomonadota bacterium]
RDQQMAEQLLADPKDRAENIMIVDLLRNDLSKICDDHSIRVPRLCELISLSKVHHLVSQITGTLRNDVSVTDVFGALFPCGSITGAPKVQAMKVISEIEGIGRGPYCGAIGYISDTGVADFSVAIRTTILANKNSTAFIPVGGGVTVRSDPAAEYDETIAKARGTLAGFEAMLERAE